MSISITFDMPSNFHYDLCWLGDISWGCGNSACHFMVRIFGVSLTLLRWGNE